MDSVRRNGSGGRKWRTAWLLHVALAIGAATIWSGCSFIKAAAYFLQPTSETINPEFNRLDGKQVLVYVWTPPEIAWDYPKLRLDLSAYLADYFKSAKEMAKAKVRVVDPLQVERYLEQQNTFEHDPAELGRHFKADIVLHLSVYEFSVRDPEMAHFYRGRLGASVHVYDMANPEEPERIALQDAKAVVPEDEPIGIESATADQVRQMTYDTFTVEVGKKFHQWDKPVQ
jgi:hypothetical protein